jgi:cytosine/adenosine deaminase-related metal-dependent hydrolase
MPESQAGPVIFAAGTLMPISSPPLRDGAVLVRGGRIEAVGDLADIGRKNPDAEVKFFPNYTMIPGAVNAHAHLGFRRKDAPEGAAFSEWLGELIGYDVYGRVIPLWRMPAAARRKRDGGDRLRRVLPA